jgi:CheY-like chemotaxis protein
LARSRSSPRRPAHHRLSGGDREDVPGRRGGPEPGGPLDDDAEPTEGGVVERGGIDLVILDYDMPRLDGLGVLEELRAQVRTATVPMIMLTARNDETEEKALDLGAQDYLTKPVQTRSLIARVKAVLKRADA